MSPAPAERLGDLAVWVRTLALRALSPFERALGASGAPGGTPLPPLWLRRHAGPVRGFRPAAEQALALLDGLGLLRPGLRVLDFGCGPGSLVPQLSGRLGPDGAYVGLDLHAPSIRWCRSTFAADPRLRFERLEPAGSAAWPVEANAWDLVLAKSVFTHLLEPEARRALVEIRRALAPGGRAMITAFLFEGRTFAGCKLPWFPCPGPAAAVRWRRSSRPTAAVAIEGASFYAWVAQAGLRVEAMLPGFHPGGSGRPTGQDTLILAEAPTQ